MSKEVKKVETKEVKNTNKAVETKKETKKAETKKAGTKKENKAKRDVAPIVKQMTNEEFTVLFTKHGLLCGSKARSNNVVYQQFGTQSRVLQQKRGYQLLLTNGHKKVKESIVESDNDDVVRFNRWYKKLGKEDKSKVIGADVMSQLSESELPREKSCKITDLDLLEKFLDFMATFEENKLVKANN